MSPPATRLSRAAPVVSVLFLGIYSRGDDDVVMDPG